MKKDKPYLHHILDCIRDIEKFYTEYGQTYVSLCAIERKIEIIGEASNKISKALHKKYPEIPWSKMIGMRNKLIHDYTSADDETTWDVVEKHLPVLKKNVRKILRDLKMKE